MKGFHMDSDAPLSNGQSLSDAVANGFKEDTSGASSSGYADTSSSVHVVETLSEPKDDTSPIGEYRTDGYDKLVQHGIEETERFYRLVMVQNTWHIQTRYGVYMFDGDLSAFCCKNNVIICHGGDTDSSDDDASSIPDSSTTTPATEQSSVPTTTVPAVVKEPEPVDATVNSITVVFGGENHEVNMDGIKTLSQLRGKIGDVARVAPKDVRMFMDGDEITARGGTHCKTVGIFNGSRIGIQMRARGGARVVKQSTKQVKQNRMNTKIAERVALMQDISQTAPMNVRNIPEVVAMGTTVQNFMTSLNANGSAHTLTHHLQSLKQNHPQNFRRCLDHMKSSGTNSASVKLNTIAGDFFVCDGVFNLSEALKTALDYPKNAINVAFEKAVVETNFTLTDFIRLFEMVDALTLSSTGTVPVTGADASMTAP